MKRNFVVILILTLLMAAVPGDIDAQFWKRKESKKHSRKHHSESESEEPAHLSKKQRKEQRRREKQERKRLKRERKHKRKEMPAQQPSADIPETGNKAMALPATVMKSTYRIDVLIPMFLDELVKDNNVTPKDQIPDKSVPGMAFYKGLTIAADSLKNAGYSVDIFIHDIASENETPEKLVAEKRLDSADLIIGAVPSKDIPVIANHARKKRINFVSAFSAADGGVKNNPFFTLVQPSLKTHCEWIVSNIAAKSPDEQVALLYRASVQVDDNAYNYLNDNGNKVTFKPLMCNHIPTKEELATVINAHQKNTVIVGVLDNAYADSLLLELSQDFPATQFEVYGMPSWSASHSKADVFDNMQINITAPFNFNPTSAIAQYVKQASRKEYGEKPSELVYRGYETMYWYAYLLKQYGTIFNDHYFDNVAAPFTQFEVVPRKDEDGKFLFYENKHVYLTTYEGK